VGFLIETGLPDGRFLNHGAPMFALALTNQLYNLKRP